MFNFRDTLKSLKDRLDNQEDNKPEVGREYLGWMLFARGVYGDDAIIIEWDWQDLEESHYITTDMQELMDNVVKRMGDQMDPGLYLCIGTYCRVKPSEFSFKGGIRGVSYEKFVMDGIEQFSKSMDETIDEAAEDGPGEVDPPSRRKFKN